MVKEDWGGGGNSFNGTVMAEIGKAESLGEGEICILINPKLQKKEPLTATVY